MATRDQLANALRVLAMDAVQQANSGHPGMPMGMAEIAEALWNRCLRHNPANPRWPDRDRFVLSNGHGSMLLYALLHLTGYDLPMEELKRFRQLHSKTAGHPERNHPPGVETTTGPLGQGLANAVGMAMAERILAEEFNRDGFDIVNHHTYAFVGDGCLMEGISHEAGSLAGTLGLSKLIVFYDDNGISIDGHVGGWFNDDTPRRFAAYGWNVIPGVDGHDSAALDAAIAAARAEPARPTLICCKTTIGKGAPNKAGSHDSHGSPLGVAEVAAARAALGWNHPAFEIPADVYEGWDARVKGQGLETLWNNKFAVYAAAHPESAREFRRRMAGELPAGWSDHAAGLLAQVAEKKENAATRKASQDAIALLAKRLPELVGGSADLAASNLTLWPGCRPFSAQRAGNYIHYGVREFAMVAILNGMALHGGVLPFGGTFLVFSDYARNGLRMAALMGARAVYVLTHDSIGLGEDGPTHQPVEQAATLRLIPGMDVWRPCDTVETMAAWLAAVERGDGPSCLLLSRQATPFQSRSPHQIPQILRGGYVLEEAAGGAPKIVLIATGSELGLAAQARQVLESQGIPARLVSMPSTTVFDRQDEAYKRRVLLPGVPRVAVEAGVSDFWRKYVGLEGGVVGLDQFGASAPATDLFRHFGFTVENVVNTAKSLLVDFS